MAVRGRHWLGLWLVFLLLVLGWVTARNSAALGHARELRAVREERSVLDGERAELLRRIREASSLDRLRPRAEALGLHMPVDSQVVNLQPTAPEP